MLRHDFKFLISEGYHEKYSVYLKRAHSINSIFIGPYSRQKAFIVASRLERALIANHTKYDHSKSNHHEGK
jgi:hypothetical protein